jgi:hypothetical protein
VRDSARATTDWRIYGHDHVLDDMVRGLGLNDLAPHVGASLQVMERDAKKMRGEPFVFTNLKTGQGLDTVIQFIRKEGML